jgi:hypothetical protein
MHLHVGSYRHWYGCSCQARAVNPIHSSLHLAYLLVYIHAQHTAGGRVRELHDIAKMQMACSAALREQYWLEGTLQACLVPVKLSIVSELAYTVLTVAGQHSQGIYCVELLQPVPVGCQITAAIYQCSKFSRYLIDFFTIITNKHAS